MIDHRSVRVYPTGCPVIKQYLSYVSSVSFSGGIIIPYPPIKSTELWSEKSAQKCGSNSRTYLLLL